MVSAGQLTLPLAFPYYPDGAIGTAATIEHMLVELERSSMLFAYSCKWDLLHL